MVHKCATPSVVGMRKTCPVCGYVFTRTYDCKRHIKIVHGFLNLPTSYESRGVDKGAFAHENADRCIRTETGEPILARALDTENDEWIDIDNEMPAAVSTQIGRGNIRGRHAAKSTKKKVLASSKPKQRSRALSRLINERVRKGLQPNRHKPRANRNKQKSSISRARRILPLLQYLTHAPSTVRRGTLNSGNRELINVLVDCCYNCLKGNIQLNTRQKQKLRPHKNILRKLIDRKTNNTNIKGKVRLLQRGGFLGSLLSIAVPALIGLLGAAR